MKKSGASSKNGTVGGNMSCDSVRTNVDPSGAGIVNANGALIAEELELGGEPACWAHLVCEECGAIVTDGHRPSCSLYDGTQP